MEQSHSYVTDRGGRMNAQALEALSVMTEDTQHIETVHVPCAKQYDRISTFCAGCAVGTTWPCAPLRTATFLRRIVLERLDT